MRVRYGEHVLAVRAEESGGEGRKVAKGIQVWFVDGSRPVGVVPGGVTPRAHLPRHKVQPCETNHPNGG
jgi:hypothetical protein